MFDFIIKSLRTKSLFKRNRNFPFNKTYNRFEYKFRYHIDFGNNF
jgi:hypothetical protein